MGALLAALAGILIGAGAAALRYRRREGRDRRALEEARRRLDDARGARERFFDITTHELRAPLSAILGYQELLHDGAYGPLTDPAREAVDRLGRAAHHLLHLIDGVIELSRIRTGDVQPDLRRTDLGVVFASAADAFRTHAAERDIEATVLLPDPLPIVRTDLDRLVRALDLVITSAVRHPAGDAMTLRVDADGDAYSVTLEPTRLALDPDADDPTVRMGIRLAVAHRIGELLGGGIELPGEPDRAGAVRFRIRAASPDAAL